MASWNCAVLQKLGLNLFSAVNRSFKHFVFVHLCICVFLCSFFIFGYICKREKYLQNKILWIDLGLCVIINQRTGWHIAGSEWSFDLMSYFLSRKRVFSQKFPKLKLPFVLLLIILSYVVCTESLLQNVILSLYSVNTTPQTVLLYEYKTISKKS